MKNFKTICYILVILLVVISFASVYAQGQLYIGRQSYSGFVYDTITGQHIGEIKAYIKETDDNLSICLRYGSFENNISLSKEDGITNDSGNIELFETYDELKAIDTLYVKEILKNENSLSGLLEVNGENRGFYIITGDKKVDIQKLLSDNITPFLQDPDDVDVVETLDNVMHPLTQGSNNLGAMSNSVARMQALSIVPAPNNVDIYFRLWTKDVETHPGVERSVTEAVINPTILSPSSMQFSGHSHYPTSSNNKAEFTITYLGVSIPISYSLGSVNVSVGQHSYTITQKKNNIFLGGWHPVHTNYISSTDNKGVMCSITAQFTSIQGTRYGALRGQYTVRTYTYSGNWYTTYTIGNTTTTRWSIYT